MNNRVKELRKHLNMNLETFGAQIGKATNTVSQYENGKRQIDDTTVLLICKTFNVSEKWLREGVGSIFSEDNAKNVSERIIKEKPNTTGKVIPLTDFLNNTHSIPYHSSIAASAGFGAEVFNEQADDFFHISPNLLPINPTQKIHCIRATGNSMTPCINDGDIIFIDMTENTFKHEGIYVLRVDNALLVKYIQWTPEGMRLISENKTYEPVLLSKEKCEYSDIAIVGKVAGVFSKY